MDTDDMKKIILADMREFHAAKWISPLTAIWRVQVPNVCIALSALNDLIKDGIVEKRSTTAGELPLVRYCPKKPTTLRLVE